jgi:transcriptional regulator with XRE-family HTH domain
MNYEKAASELLRALRGRRSQVAFSRRLGSRANVAYTWESGRRFPTASKALSAAARAGVDVRGAVTRFYRTGPAWLAHVDPATPDGVAELLRDLRGRARIGDLAARTGRSRFRVSRWLRGDAEPRLPDFLRLVEATSLRLLDFLAAFVDPARLPSAAAAWAALERSRAAAYEVPWSHSVLRALELQAYRRLPRHQEGFLASRLGIPIEEERRCLDVLVRTGQVRKHRGRYVPGEVLTVDTRRDPAEGRRLKAWWARVALERLEADDEGLYSYNLFTVSEADLARLRELHLAYFRELRAIVAQSAPAERVVLANVQLLGLDRP